MKKYAQVGTGGRGIYSYVIPLVKEYTDVAELVGICDRNPKRMKLACELAGKEIPQFTDFDEMLRTTKPDTVIVTTIDATHDDFIVRALDFGCDVISEKPVTTTPEKAMRIVEAEKRSGKKVTVTFNVRYNPTFGKLKDIVNSGVLGDILSIHYEWMLDRSHGADYFRRWHRNRANSGSLLIHKSTHHFDIANWLLEDTPKMVNAFGTRRFYGPTREQRSERCLTCPYKKSCEFYLDMPGDEMLTKLYLNCEDADGYFRDKCVFSPEIDIEDTLSVSVLYNKGTTMSYTLTAHSPFEKTHMILTGTKARLEFCSYYSMPSSAHPEPKQWAKITYPDKSESYITFAPLKATGHGGADDMLRDSLFRGYVEDGRHRSAGLEAGLASAAIGMAANISMKEQRSVVVEEMFKK